MRTIFKVQAPGGLIYLEERFNGGFLCYRFGGLIFGGAYTWRGLFSEFYGSLNGNTLGFRRQAQQLQLDSVLVSIIDSLAMNGLKLSLQLGSRTSYT